MAGERITIDISILQGIFGDLTKLQQQLAGVSGGAMALDSTASGAFSDIQKSMQGVTGSLGGVEAGFDATMRGVVGDLMQPIQRTQELEAKLRDLGTQVRTSKSVAEISRLKKEIAATQKELDGVDPGRMESKVGGAAGRMRSMFKSLVAPVAGAFAISGITSFIGSMAKAAGAQQQFDSSLKNMLRSKERADALSAQVKSFAATTPFELPEVQKATTQMLAFGFGAEDTIPTLRKLGDVAAGLGQPVGDLAYLYGITRVQGRLYTNDLMQFANRGIPIIEELSKVLGVSQGEVKSLVEQGKVGFPQVEQVLNNLTASGSKFGGLMAAQSQTITGQMSNLSDAWGQFKTDLGLSLAPLITRVIGGLSGGIEYLKSAIAWMQAHGPLVKNVLTGIAIAAGVYAAVLAVNSAALMYNNTLQAIAAIRTGALAAYTGVVTAATALWTGAQWLLNVALNANPIGLVVLAIAALVGGIMLAWNKSEGFRAAVYGLWEAAKSTFSGLVDLAKTYLTPLGEMLGGYAQILKGVFTLSWGDVSAGWKQMAKGTSEMLKSLADTPGKVREIGMQAGMAYAQGDAEGRASFQADQAKKAEGTNAYNATPAAPGQNVGAAQLVGGQPAAAQGAGAGAGVTVGGSTGSGRVITMNIEMKNSFALPKDGNMGAREVAERVIGQLVAKLNDFQFAMG